MELVTAQSIMRDHPEHQRAPYDPQYESGSAYIVDRYCSIDQACVPITDTGFAHADAAYDVTTSTRGFIFRLDEHMQRFAESCRKFRLQNPYSQEQTREILINLVERTGMKDCFIWWCVTRGNFPSGLQKIDPAAYENKFYAYVTDFRFYADDALRQKGMDIMIAKSHLRIPESSVDPTAKNFHWMDMKLTMFEAHDAGYEWSVLTDEQGFLTEAPGSNIFLIKAGELFTPANGCLHGVTRLSVLELAEEMGMKTHVGRIHSQELLEADEAFLTSSAGGIAPVNSVNGAVLGDVSGPGARTVAIHNAYWAKRWGGWKGLPVSYGNDNKDS